MYIDKQHNFYHSNKIKTLQLKLNPLFFIINVNATFNLYVLRFD